jgi:hypothetical protein
LEAAPELRQGRADSSAQETDNTGKSCPHVFAARADRFVDDIQKAGVVDTTENIENLIVRNGRLITVWTRVVELDANVTGQRCRFADTGDQLGERRAPSGETACTRAADKLPAVEHDREVRVLHFLNETE